MKQVALKCSVEDGKGKSHYSCPELLGVSKKKSAGHLFLQKPEFMHTEKKS